MSSHSKSSIHFVKHAYILSEVWGEIKEYSWHESRKEVYADLEQGFFERGEEWPVSRSGIGT